MESPNPPGKALDWPLKGALEYPDQGGNKRYIRQKWLRDPNGEFLPNFYELPRSHRTPNGRVWGHNLDELFWINRFPNGNCDVMTCWSRSMLKDYGENYLSSMWRESEEHAVPHLRKPWPLLALDAPESEALPAAADELKDLGVPFEPCSPYDVKPCKTSSGDLASVDAKCTPEDCPSNPANFPASTSGLASDREEDDRTVVVVVLRSPTPDTSSDFSKDKSSSQDPNSKSTSEHAEDRPEDAPQRGKQDLESGDARKDDSNSRETDSKPAFDDSATVPNDAPKPVSESSATDDAQPTDNVDKPAKKLGKYDFEPYPTPISPRPAPTSPFYVENLPPLQERIPSAFFPDFLLVHDPHDVTLSPFKQSEPSTDPVPLPIKYKRKYPITPAGTYRSATDADGSENVAHLYLHRANLLGQGNHSIVYKSALQLPAPLTARTPNGRVRVAAKVAFGYGFSKRDKEMLENEARVYDGAPKHLSEEYCGFNCIPPIVHPVPVGAVMPKFFGFYEPWEQAGRKEWTSPILLLEECGEPIEPQRLTLDQKIECQSFMHRLHAERILQGSFYERNILAQPGPLYLPPSQRSRATPSFRIIDFGRGKTFEDVEHDVKKRMEFDMEVRHEQRHAKTALLLDD
ncbi:hypothetical protein BDW22DRAFT_1356027 [Trametopsis cervina]|nr:hypothetical protein BDW22DRAFT_1356027 [Trametopsis cervina]